MWSSSLPEEWNANCKWHSSLSVKHGWFECSLIWDPKSRPRGDNIQIFLHYCHLEIDPRGYITKTLEAAALVFFWSGKGLKCCGRSLVDLMLLYKPDLYLPASPAVCYGCKNGIAALGINYSGFQHNRNLRMASAHRKTLLKKFKCVLTWLGQRKYYPAASSWDRSRNCESHCWG